MSLRSESRRAQSGSSPVHRLLRPPCLSANCADCLTGITRLVAGQLRYASEYEVHRSAHAQPRPEKVDPEGMFEENHREGYEHAERDRLLEDFQLRQLQSG